MEHYSYEQKMEAIRLYCAVGNKASLWQTASGWLLDGFWADGDSLAFLSY